MLQDQETIPDLVRKLEEEDKIGNTLISKYVRHSMRENLDKIDAYANSKHISGSTDALGRDKPFFNIVTSAINIWYRATDIDRKNIKMKATKQAHVMLSFVMTILFGEYMKKTSFGMWLNRWGKSLAKNGSCISKFIEVDGELISKVMPWGVMIVDPVDFDNNVKIEKLWLTPAQLRAKKGYNQKIVEDLIDQKQARETIEGQQVDNKSDYIELYEVHGELPESLLLDDPMEATEKQEKNYTQQMHVISYLAKNEGKGSDDYTLFKGKEGKDPYVITHLIEEEGRTLSIGSVENLFQAQWMTNHSQKNIKDQLDLASKLVFQTSDGNFEGQNVLSNIENGQIMTHAVNMPITQVANNSHDISALQAFGQQWKSLGMEINGINEAMTQAPKSGTAWRQTQAALQEAHSLFELMTENKGLSLEYIIRTYFIPYLKKQMDTSDEIAAILDEHGIKKIDSIFIPSEASRRINKRIEDKILSTTPEDLMRGDIFTPEMQEEQVAGEAEAIQKTLDSFGSQRFIKPSQVPDKTWKESLKDFEWEIEVNITGENKDEQATMETLSTVFQTVASLGGQPMPEEMKVVFNKILNLTGAISPMEIAETKPAVPQPLPEPAQPLPAQQV